MTEPLAVEKMASMVAVPVHFEDFGILWPMLQEAMEEQRRLEAIGPFHGPPSPPDPSRCRCDDGECLRHADLTEDERAAVEALHASDIEVGYEGIGGFAAGQAEEVLLVMRRAGFTVTRS